MGFTIQKNKKPDLPICQFNCDKKLAKRLDDYEVTRFMNSHGTHMFIGKPRSGKTSTLYQFFKSPKLFKRTFHNVYVFQPSHSRVSMKDNLFGVLPEEQIYDELTEETLGECLDVIKSNDPDENNCILFDDMGAYLKDKSVSVLMKELIMNRRHYRTSVFFLCQTYYSAPKEIRRLFSNLFVFKVSKDELQNIFDEAVEDKEKHSALDKIRKVVFDQPYRWLFLNTDSGRMFKMWDEIIFTE